MKIRFAISRQNFDTKEWAIDLVSPVLEVSDFTPEHLVQALDTYIYPEDNDFRVDEFLDEYSIAQLDTTVQLIHHSNTEIITFHLL